MDKKKSASQVTKLKFVKSTSVNFFTTELTNTITALYRIWDSNIVSDLAMNHLLSTLDESLRGEAKIFQLMGNTTLENLLELVNKKMGLQSFSYGVEYAAIASQNSTNDRLTRIENMVRKLLMDHTSQNNRPF